MLRYAISDRHLLAGDDDVERLRLVAQQAALLAREGVDFFQIREKDLSPEATFTLACAVRDAVQRSGTAMRVILNGPEGIAAAAGVGWHRSSSTSPGHAGAESVACHTLDGVEQERGRAGLLLFAPVFEKRVHGQAVLPGQGLAQLREAVRCAGPTPVLALGGVTAANAVACVEAGAAGVASIRMFLRPNAGARRTLW